jgi:hypothetical protein
MAAELNADKQRRTRNNDNADMRFELTIIDAPEQLCFYTKPPKIVNLSTTRFEIVSARPPVA